jgi:hypothetical protein
MSQPQTTFLRGPSLSLISLNCDNSLTTLQGMAGKNSEKPKIFCLQEPHLNQHGIPDSIDGMHTLYPHSTRPRVAIYLPHALHLKPEIVMTRKSYFISIQIILGDGPIIISNLYSEHGEPKAWWETAPLLPNHRNQILVGDFNCRHPLWYGDRPLGPARGGGTTYFEKSETAVDELSARGLKFMGKPGVPTYFPHGARQGDPAVLDLTFAGPGIASRVAATLGPRYGSDHTSQEVTICKGTVRVTISIYADRLNWEVTEHE